MYLHRGSTNNKAMVGGLLFLLPAEPAAPIILELVGVCS